MSQSGKKPAVHASPRLALLSCSVFEREIALLVRDATHTTQAPEDIWRLGAAMFIAGPLVCVASLVAITRYPLTPDLIKRLTAQNALQ